MTELTRQLGPARQAEPEQVPHVRGPRQAAVGNAALGRLFGGPVPGGAEFTAGGNAAASRLLGAQVRRCGPDPCSCTEDEEPELRVHRSAVDGTQVRRCGAGPCSCADEPEYPVRRSGTGPAGPSPAFLGALDRSGPGTALPDGFRSVAEDRFGADFGAVRLHTDSAAGTASEVISARAFTVGDDVYFARGEYRPETVRGQRLLAHELTHVVQGGGPRAAGSWLSHPADPAERAAEAAADAFLAGGTVSTVDSSPARVHRDGPPAPDTAAAPAIITAVRGDDVPGVVRLLDGHTRPELAALRGTVNAAIGTRLESWLFTGGPAAIPDLEGFGAVPQGPAPEAEHGIRLLWPALTLVERLRFYDEGWRELEQAQLDVIRAASADERAVARTDTAALAPVYAAMEPKEEFQARSLIDPTPDGRYAAAEQLLRRAPGVFHDEEDAVFDSLMDLSPAQRRQFYTAHEPAISSLMSDSRRDLLRNLAYGSEADALIARLREATEGRSDDMAAVQDVVDRAVRLFQERGTLRASLQAGALPPADRATVETRLRELDDLDKLLRFDRGSDGTLDATGFLGRLADARGDAGAFAADAQRLGQFASPAEARRQAFETAKQRVLLADGDVDTLRAALIGLHAPRTTAPGPGGPSAADQAEDERLRRELLADPAVAAVIDGLTPYQRMRVTDAVTADAFVETLGHLNDALQGGQWGPFFVELVRIARNPAWRARYQATAPDPFGVYAQVHGDQRAIMETILADPAHIPLRALLAFTGDADVLAAAASELTDDQRGQLRTGYLLVTEPPIGPPTEAEAAAVTAYHEFEAQLRSSQTTLRVFFDDAGYQRVLWAVLGSDPTRDEMATGGGRFRAAELMYRQQQATLGLDRGAAAGFTEADETMVAAGREFAARFEPLRAARTLSTVDFAALAALHDRFTGRAGEFEQASNTVGELAGMIAATVAGVVVIAATGGAATPGVVALAAAAGAGSRVITREMIGGDFYTAASATGARDALLGAVDAALAVVGASLAARGAQLLGVGGHALTSGAARVAGAVAEEASGAAVEAGSSLARRVAAGAVESALDGAFSGAVSEAFGTMTDEATWRRGVWSGLVRVGEAALVAGLTGLATGGLLGAAMPLAGAGAGRLWNAVVGQGIERKLADAGASALLADARRAAQAGQTAEVDRLVGQLESHLTADEAGALRRQLNAELGEALGPSEARLLAESARVEDGIALLPEQLEAEFDVVRRSEPRPSTTAGYVDEVELGNGHTWRRREDGTWCRFSTRSLCGTTINGAPAMSATALGNVTDPAQLRRMLDRLDDELDIIASHPDAPAMADEATAVRRLLDAGDLPGAADRFSRLRRRVDISLSSVHEGALERPFGGAEEGRMGTRTPAGPSGGGHAVHLDVNAPPAGDPTGSRLLAHVRDALERFEHEGFTDAQRAALRDNPQLEAAYRGARIDEFAKAAVEQDPELQHVIVTGLYEPGADFYDSLSNRWYDITTVAAWKDHVTKYGAHGSRLPTERL
ncbi:eCIS core domain-containing protein [Amycolatopsis vastitatis]|uniref:eCIS core domain-containing protein n=1 Tax=Amycolatopsis vastitatis TaxID=1905142 RepID=UPI00196AD846|nr:DUF4157 domain-containing protein [Amycolatopsis vastitatis]